MEQLALKNKLHIYTHYFYTFLHATLDSLQETVRWPDYESAK